MKEYRITDDLPYDLKKEIEDNKLFFDEFDGKSLDEQQRIACVLNDCDLEIIAGAGTGKTQTLVAKSSYLIEHKNIDPSEILCLSFSNSSVKDLSERLKYPIETRTIHAFGLSIIRGYESKRVLDEYEFKSIFNEYLKQASERELENIRDYCEEYLVSSAVKSRLKELDYEEEKFNYLISNSNIHFKLQDFINLLKGKDYDVSDLKDIKKACEKEYEEKLHFYHLKNIDFLRVAEPVFRFYQSFLFKNRLIDFNDMINKALKIIETKGLVKNYKYIFVDEYQDMSYKNFLLVKAVKDKTNANLVVVGDDWQSIYGFRDSDLKLFTHFNDYFPNANRVFIEKIYRSPQQLIDTAGKFVMKNENQFVKSLKSDLSIDKPINIVYHSKRLEVVNNCIYNLVSNLSNDNEVMILGRHRKDIDDFLKHTDLIKKGRSRNYKKITNKSETMDNVEFRTIHKAKGLEADYVIIIRVIDDYVGFPNKMRQSYFMELINDWDYDDKLGEERRLFYVALTRAKKGVYIFTSENNESKYISELKEDNLDNLKIIKTDDKSTYSHLNEFNHVEKVKAERKNKKVKLDSLINEEDSDVAIKANLKRIGNSLIKSKDYDEAEDFYKKLLTNKFFLNDYYPYRKLVEVYKKKKDSANIIKTIGDFFKSDLYCNDSQIIWFKLEFRKACKNTSTNFKLFDEYLSYFNDHGLKNKDNQNIPVPIAARIKTSGKVLSQKDFDEKYRKKELENNYKYARKYETSEKALYYFEQLWNQEGFNKNLTAYKRLCSFYNKTGQYEKVIQISNEYFQSSAKKTKSSPDWFRKKIEKAEKMLKNNSSENNQKFDINVLENSDEIMDKANLKNMGNNLIKSKDYDEAEDFYKKLLTNKFFLNDYYPYRKLVEVYRKKKRFLWCN